jgi:hypothetical protein
MAELPLHLKQLETLPSALDIIRLLYNTPSNAASVDEICDTLDISDRRFGKANRRLVTTGYLAMQADFVYELTSKGITAGEELEQYDASAPIATPVDTNKVQRDFILALPRTLQAQKANPLHLAFSAGDAYETALTVALRISAIHADVSSSDELLLLDGEQNQQTITITPQPFEQVRVRVQVFQLSADGDNVTECGGFYVDADVTTEDVQAGLVAYGTTIPFNPI